MHDLARKPNGLSQMSCLLQCSAQILYDTVTVPVQLNTIEAPGGEGSIITAAISIAACAAEV